MDFKRLRNTYAYPFSYFNYKKIKSQLEGFIHIKYKIMRHLPLLEFFQFLSTLNFTLEVKRGEKA